MAATFIDTQNDRSRANGRRLETAADLVPVLEALRARQPFFLLLNGDDGQSLTVGWGPDVGCAQHTDERGVATVAVAPEPLEPPMAVEFLAGDTSTPVSSRYCMSTVTIERIAARFVEHGDRDPGLSWEIV